MGESNQGFPHIFFTTDGITKKIPRIRQRFGGSIKGYVRWR